MNKQEIFDTAVRGLRKQGAPGYDNHASGGQCRYLSGEGNKCAVGILFNEKELRHYAKYSGGISALVVDSRLNKNFELRPFFYDEQDLLVDLQDAHDDAAQNSTDATGFLDLFDVSARDVADKYDLNPAVLDEVDEPNDPAA